MSSETRVIGWTGHRPDLFEDARRAEDAVWAAARGVVADGGAVEFRCGGQRGVDLWAADAGLTLGARVSIILPLALERFTAEWSDGDRRHLYDACHRAASVQIVGQEALSPALAFDLRNERLVDGADLLVAVWTGLRRGGTFHTLCAARVGGVAVREAILAPAANPGLLVGRGL